MKRKNKLFGYEDSLRELRSAGWTYSKMATRFKVSTPTVYSFFHPELKHKYRTIKGKTLSKYVSQHQQDLRKKVIDALGGKCCRCGFSDIRALQLDHIHGGGVKEIRKLGHNKIYRKILSNIESESLNYQVLCANCNWIKRYENKENRNGINNQHS